VKSGLHLRPDGVYIYMSILILFQTIQLHSYFIIFSIQK